MSVERKYERDIDLLLAEEFATNPDFANFFKAKTKFEPKRAKVIDFWVSKSNSLGESDLIVLYEADDHGHFALLIEDKVDAPLQPEQAERYRLRAEKDKASGIYDDYEVILCAPSYYIQNRSDLSGFDRTITLEEVAKFLRASSNSLKSIYRAEFLESAGTKRINKWARENDPLTNEFWTSAFEIASRDFPELEMKPLTLTKGSSWINFRPRDFPTNPKRIYVSFKGDRGQMDLTFSGTTAHVFHAHVAELLVGDMTLHQTEASTAIRLQVPGFDISDGVDAGMLKVRKAFEASVRLIKFFRENRVVLESAARFASPK